MMIRFTPEIALAACLLTLACRNVPPGSTGVTSEPAPVPSPLPADPDACLTEVLQRAGLNRFGDPPDTMYAGGSPLFDERTGETTSRRDYVQARHPELVAQCPEEAK